MKLKTFLGAAALVVAVSPLEHTTADGAVVAGSASVSLHVEGITGAFCKVAVRTALSLGYQGSLPGKSGS